MWKTNVTCQKYHNTSALGQLFEVGAIADAQPASVQPDADVSQAVQASLSQASTRLEELEKRKNNIIKSDTDQYDFAEWLN
jgi:type II secretory pathway component PulM